MARRKRDARAEEIAAAILEESGARTADEAQEALRRILGPAIEAMLRAELDAHLGYPSNDKSPKASPNRRNGYTPKTVRTSAGEVEISVPRDRDGSFEPVAVPKGSSDLSGVESRVLSMYARGMSQRDIAQTVREIYGFSMSAETVSAITDRVREDLERWRSRPLEPVYAFLFVDCMYVPVRDGRGARNAAVYVALAYDLQGRKDVLGLWMDDAEGAHRWMQVFDELRARGVEDVLYVSADGVSGLAEGLRSVFPGAVCQRCIVHLVRNSTKYVPQKECAAFCRSIRAVYAAPSLAAAGAAWESFRAEWARYPGAVAVWERSIDQVWQLFSCGSEVRRVMYTTNALESVNASFRRVVRRGCFPGEGAVMKLLYLRVLELCRRWGEGCHHAGWSQVRNQLLCDEGIRRRVERYM
ncbi:MAG: IS256 family transposase [Coriobacteriia bacterium]|nr:IS256 family transposase [Coriobacteriia bacterium]